MTTTQVAMSSSRGVAVMMRRIQEEFNEWFLEHMGDVDNENHDGRLCPKGVEQTHFDKDTNVLTLTAFDEEKYYINLNVLKDNPYPPPKRPRNAASSS